MANADDGGKVMPRIKVARRRYILYCGGSKLTSYYCTFGVLIKIDIVCNQIPLCRFQCKRTNLEATHTF